MTEGTFQFATYQRGRACSSAPSDNFPLTVGLAPLTISLTDLLACPAMIPRARMGAIPAEVCA